MASTIIIPGITDQSLHVDASGIRLQPLLTLPADVCVHVGHRSAEVAETQTLLQEVALPSHVWRRHSLPGKSDGGRTSLGDMLHKPNVTLEQVSAYILSSPSKTKP